MKFENTFSLLSKAGFERKTEMDSAIENTIGSANGSNRTMCDIAFECDDFLTVCAPNAKEKESVKNMNTKFDDIMKGIQDKLQDTIDENIDTDNPLKVLDECLEFYEQSYGMSVLDELDEIAINEESKILDQSIQALETVKAELQREGDVGDIDFDRLREDFNASKIILNDTIGTVFKDKSEEVTLLLSELLKNGLGDKEQQDYLNLSNEQFSDSVIDTLTNMGVLEYNPEDDTQIRLTRLNS